MPARVVDAITDLAPTIAASLASRRLDCGYACAAWRNGLKALGIHSQLVGGVGIDEDAYGPDYRLTPLDRRSGYLEDDGQVHRHWWLAVGNDQLLFDPTAHQFDGKGGVSLDRYTLDGERWRAQVSL